MLARELLRNKRLGQTLNQAEIAFLVRGMADGSLGNEQLGAFAMAVALNGMETSEQVADAGHAIPVGSWTGTI